MSEEKTKINIKAQRRYDELMAISEHGHYETMFKVIHEATAELQSELAAANKRIEELEKAEVYIGINRGPL